MTGQPVAFLDKMPTYSEAQFFDHESGFGILIRFSAKGLGFGEIVFAVKKETGAVTFDPEDMTMETCAEIMSRLVGTEVVAYREVSHG